MAKRGPKKGIKRGPYKKRKPATILNSAGSSKFKFEVTSDWKPTKMKKQIDEFLMAIGSHAVALETNQSFGIPYLEFVKRYDWKTDDRGATSKVRGYLSRILGKSAGNFGVYAVKDMNGKIVQIRVFAKS